MQPRTSAGLVMYRIQNGQLEVLLAHPGGPLFAHKDEGHWTIPKGEIEPGEDFIATAIREFKEEAAIDISAQSELIELASIRHQSSRIVHARPIERECDDSFPLESCASDM